MDNSIKPYRPNFNARCAKVRDANWVCQTINHKLPHFSSTKMQPFIEKYLQKNAEELKYNGEQNTLSEIYFFLDDVIFKEGNQKLIDTVYSIKKMIRSFGEKRLDVNEAVGTGTISGLLHEAILLMSKYKLGNCTENAILAEFICKLNGIKNATCAILNKTNTKAQESKIEPLDHFICVVNTDGSKFDGKIKKSTIIIDPWLSKADFANNMELYFRNECTNFFELAPEEKLYYQIRELVNLSDNELEKYRKALPEFIFNSKTHNFMQKK